MNLLNYAVAGLEGEEDGLSVLFVSLDFIDIDAPFLSVNLDDLSGFVFGLSFQNFNFVVLSDGEASNSVFLSEFLGQSAGHYSSSLG